MSLISCICLLTGFFFLSPNATYPLALPLLNLTLIIFISLSLTYASVFRSPSPDNISDQRHYLCLAFIIIPLRFIVPYIVPFTPSSQITNASIFALLFAINSVWVVIFKKPTFQFQQFLSFQFYWFMQGTLFLTTLFSWHIIMFISITISSFWEPNSDIQLLTSFLLSVLRYLDGIIERIMPLSWQKVKDFLKNVISGCDRIDLWVAVLSQIFFPSSAPYEVSVRLLLVLSWIAGLVLLSASHGFGISKALLKKLVLISVIQIVHLDQSRVEIINACFNIVAGLTLIRMVCWITSDKGSFGVSSTLPVFMTPVAEDI